MGGPRRKTLKVAFGILIALFLAFLLIAYLRYVDLKQAVLKRISTEMTVRLGQTVRIGDLSLRFPAAIRLEDIRIENPRGFPDDLLLQMRGFRLDLRIKPLLKRKFSFQSVTLVSPELTLIKNSKGQWNLSQELMDLFSEKSEKSAWKYQIDELRVESGKFVVDKDPKFRIERINLRVRDLSSRPGQQTSLKGDLVYGGNKVRIEGWISLYDKPNEVSLSISSEAFEFSPLAPFFERFKLDAKGIEAGGCCKVEGSIEKGLRLSSDIQIRKIRSSLLAREKKAHMRMVATFSHRHDSLAIHAASLLIEDLLSLSLTGNVTGVRQKPTYQAEIRIEKLDLSQLALRKDFRLGGILSSNRLMIAGRLEAKPPVVSGKFKVAGGQIEMPRGVMKGINADIDFSFDKEISTKVEVAGIALRAGEYVFKKPVQAKLSALLHGSPERVNYSFSFTFSPFEVSVKENETIHLESTQGMMKGSFDKNVLKGESSFDLRGIRYTNHEVKSLKSSSTIHYERDEVALQNFKLEADELKASIPSARIIPFEKRGYRLETKGLDLAYRDLKALFRKLDVHLVRREKTNGISGEVLFSEGDITFQGISCNRLSGNARLEGTSLSLLVSQAEAFGGKIRLVAQGRVSSPLFPVKLNLSLEDVDLGLLSKWGWISSRMPFEARGTVKRATFDGVLEARNSFQGQSLLEVEGISLLSAQKKRPLVTDARTHLLLEWLGKDLAFKGSASSGALAPQFSGLLRSFSDEKRQLQLKVSLKETKVADLRETLWDLLPDQLLYIRLKGSFASEASLDYGQGDLAVGGTVRLVDVAVEGENGEYAIGPIHGTLPISYRRRSGEKEGGALPFFEKSEFDRLFRSYSQKPTEKGFHKISIGQFRYGFHLLDGIHLWVEQKGHLLHIERFDANIFGGQLMGSAVVEFSDQIQYRAGFLIKGLSLSALCTSIPPIKGFLSGRLDGIASLKGDERGFAGLLGTGDFWTYDVRDEKRMISKEFLQRLGSQPMLEIYLRDRPFDKGTMSFYLKDGFLVFRELEISNRNFFGVKDLSVSVAPFNNRISFDHLLSTIAAAAERTQQRKERQ